MSPTKNKMNILMCSDDPDTILSYGILSSMLIDKWYKYYNISYCSLQYQMGKPQEKRTDKGQLMYTKYPAHNQGERNPTFLPQIINETKPALLWSNFDLQHYGNLKQYVKPGLTWIGWIPWDNHDPAQIPRANDAFANVNVRVAISKFGHDFLNQNGCKVDDYIYNIVDTENYYPLEEDDKDVADWRKKNGCTENTKLLLFVGRPNWRKRVPHLLRIVQELKLRGNDDFKLIFHSNMNDPARTVNIPELIHALGIENYIIPSQFNWDAGIAKKDLRVLYNAADLYVAPHGGEGFGMPIGESMACGTPFIASDICTTREFAGENKERGLAAPVHYPMDHTGRPYLDGGIARPWPVIEEFADLIEQAWHDKPRLKKMGENGAEWTKKECSPQIVADRWRGLLDTFDIKFGMVEDYE